MTTVDLSKISAELDLSRTEILRRLHAHSSSNASAEQVALSVATTDTLNITPYKGQGYNRSTYLVRVASVAFILTVNTPRPLDNRPTISTIGARRAYQQRLQDKGLPVAALVGSAFKLPRSGYECELTSFINGYHVPLGRQLTLSEIESYAHTLASMHLACEYWAPPETERPLFVAKTNLPQGFVHYDTHRGNMLFDARTNRLNAIIDFEQARYETFAKDLGQAVRMHFSSIRISRNLKIQADVDGDSIRNFLALYGEVRPILSSELEFIIAAVVEDIPYELLYINRTMGNPLTAEQMNYHRGYLRKAVHEQLDRILGTLRR